MNSTTLTNEQLTDEVADLRILLDEANDTLQSLRTGEVDAVLVPGPGGDQLFTLKGADEPYRVLIEEMNQGAVTLSADGSILYCNRRFADLLKAPLAGIAGMVFETLVMPSERPRFAALQKKSYFGAISGEITLRARDASPVPLQIAMSPLPAKSAATVCLIATDITQIREAAEALKKSEQHFRGLADAMPQIVWTARPDGTIDYYNQRWSEYTNSLYDQAEGWARAPVLHPDDVQKCVECWKHSFTTGEPYQVAYRLRRASDGAYRWHLGRALPIRGESGEIVRWFGTSTDIDDQKRAEAEIQELNQKLEHRVLELEAANQELEAFSYSVSHDLRAPLRAINGFAEIVLEEFGSQVSVEGRKYLGRIREGGKRMGQLMDDLLAFSHLSRQPVKRRTVNMVRILRDVLRELNPRQENREIEWRIGDLPPCEGDPSLLKQVWVNLLSNAVKYTRGRAVAEVEIGWTGEPGAITYFVRDNGTGFDMQYADKLFGVFQRLHRIEDFEGTGVGLAIVQRIVHRHGGRVWAEAAVDRGATFYFTLTGEIN